MTTVRQEIKDIVSSSTRGVEYTELAKQANSDSSTVGEIVEELVATGELKYTSDWKVQM